MSVIERSITVVVCTECGEIAGASAHGHAPPVEWHWESVEYAPAHQLAGAVSAITAHRDRWVKANGTNPDNARPADLELWALVGGIEGGQ